MGWTKKMYQAVCVVTPGLLKLVLSNEGVAGLATGQFRAAIAAYLPTPLDFNVLDVYADRQDETFIVLVGGDRGIRDGSLLQFAGELDHTDRIWLYYEEITIAGTPTGHYRATVSIC
jgi:hypothetical protein